MTLLVANWKMNLDIESGLNLAKNLADFVSLNKSNNQIVICPPFTMLHQIGETLKKSDIKLGGQDCSIAEKGAYTGDISTAMLKDSGCDYVILGHSERRGYHNESSEIVKQKAELAHKHHLNTIICVGESEEERVQKMTLQVLEAQLLNSIPNTANSNNTIIAYEPVWAIGTGENPTTTQIEDVAQFIGNTVKKSFSFEKWPVILYGGSVKANNSKDILQINAINGLLVGGASLIYTEFTDIITNTLKVTKCKQY
jgi:triosephosphate isomerase (TIM)